jgi:cell division protein FtsI/penicillin-binding protein 2
MRLAHRELRRSRVLVAAAGLFFGLVVVWLRIGWIQVARHGYYDERADRNQEQRVLLKPVRGNLLDRHGRLLARDLLTYSVSAAPGEMTNPRATARTLAGILGLESRRLERAFATRPRFLWVARRVPPEVGQRIADLHPRGVYLSQETRRDYPLGPAAAEILGRTNVDNVGVEGIELQFDDVLRGRPGWANLFKDGRGRSVSLPQGLRRAPVDGQQVVLTLDADLQSIVETHLTAALDTLKALRGFAMFMDPSTGEVLAAVTVPHLPPGKESNWNFTDTFEPGSTFKLVVASAALEEGVARPDDVFEASATGAAVVVPGTTFHDVHRAATYTFADAVRWSSNIVMGRLGLKLGPERLYRYATALGFGSITGIDFPGEAGGRLRSPDHWSLRSTPTISIGHEVAVTPLQLTLAYAAIANGGVLMRPMLAREIRDGSGAVVQRLNPSSAQRVFSPATCAQMRRLLAAVVDSGTGKAARVNGFTLAGKTGTAQKYDAAIGTYGKGLYLSSFAGFAPADEPRLVGVVVIDEPRGKHYYGGDVAAPVFKQVVVDLLGLPNGALRRPATQIVARPPDPAPVTVPDLRLLPRTNAERLLAERSLYGHFEGDGPRVLAQQPPAGVAVERGAHIAVWLSAPADSTGTMMPDLIGLTVREAMRVMSSRQLRTRVIGQGEVVEQVPAPGAPLTSTLPVVRCRAMSAGELATWLSTLRSASPLPGSALAGAAR